MKKLGLVLFSAIAAGAACARDLYSSEDHPGTPIEVCFADPLSLPQSNWNVYGLRLNLLFGQSFAVYGLDLGLAGRCRNKFVGLAAQTFNWIENDMTGAQFGGLANVVNGNACGLQLGGAANCNHGGFTGLQAAFVNYDGAYVGAQLGALNWNKSVSVGAQFAIANIDVNEFHGFSLGAINYTGKLVGAQMGVVNVVSETAHGVQLGLFNATPALQGLQIGLLNVIGNGMLPIMPIINGCF